MVLKGGGERGRRPSSVGVKVRGGGGGLASRRAVFPLVPFSYLFQ